MILLPSSFIIIGISRKTKNGLHECFIVDLNPSITINIQPLKGLGRLFDDNPGTDKSVKRNSRWDLDVVFEALISTPKGVRVGEYFIGFQDRIKVVPTIYLLDWIEERRKVNLERKI